MSNTKNSLKIYVRMFKVNGGRRLRKLMNKTYTIHTYTDYLTLLSEIRHLMWNEYSKKKGRETIHIEAKNGKRSYQAYPAWHELTEL